MWITASRDVVRAWQVLLAAAAILAVAGLLLAIDLRFKPPLSVLPMG